MGAIRHVRVLARITTAALVLGAFAFLGSSSSALSGCTSFGECPRAADDNYEMKLGAPLRVGAPGLLANDEGIAGTHVSVMDSDEFSWNNATIQLNADGSFVYTPDPQEPVAGEDSFGYALEDPEGGFAYGTVYVSVWATVRSDAYETGVNRLLTVDAPGIFGNDLGIDPYSITADGVTDEGGSVSVNDDGSFVYQPKSKFRGTDTFRYEVFDTNDDNTYVATVLIGVGIPKPTPPREASPPEEGFTPRTLPNDPGIDPGSTEGSGSRGSSRTTRPGSTGTTTKSSRTENAKDGRSSASPDPEGGSAIDGDAAAAQQSSDSSSSPLPVIIVMLVVAGAVGGTLWWLRRRRVAAGAAAGGTPEPPTV
jgi:hypothetical protein